jgi:serine/threonine protein kinase
MSAPAAADRNLLFGILALQMDFITRDALVAAMNAWVLDKSKPLGQILNEQGALPPDTCTLLESLVQKHLELHGEDSERSLASIGSLGSSWDDLQQLADQDVQTSLARLGAAHAETTRPYVVPLAQSSGARFRILRPHAKGGLGEVFIAEDTELHRQVALKEIQTRHAADLNSRSRFLLEAEITGGLEHPGIVPVYGLGHYADGRPFYAMRFIKGDNLKEAIARFHQCDAHVSGSRPARFDSLAFRQLLGRFLDVCNAVAYAHARGVLHRDLKPGNIMLGKYGETLVVDWGLAKPVGKADGVPPIAVDEATLRPASGSSYVETQAGAAVGTPAYMSPEQAAGQLDQLGPASDVYSLGATLYHLLTGQPPVRGDDLRAVLQKVERGEIAEPRHIQPNVPRPLEAVCLKAMARVPANRYDSALELAQDVEHWLGDEPVTALREPRTVALRRWARKHPGPVAGIAAALLVGLLGLAVSSIVLGRKNRELELARLAETERAEGERQAKQEALAAATAEKNAKEIAETRAAETQAVLEFVQQRIFAAARPEGKEGGLGHDVTLRKAIEAAMPFVEKSFTNKPIIEARLRRTVGVSFLDLGEAKLAVEQFQAARALYTRLLGPNDPGTLNVANDLAVGLDALGQHAEALKLWEDTLTLTKAALGPDHPQTLTSMNNLAYAYGIRGRSAEALKVEEEVLALRKAKLGPYHLHTLQSMSNLAAGYRAVGRDAEALKLLEETLALQKSHLGAEHPDTLATMQSLAVSYESVGRRHDALKLREETLALRKAKLGPEHPDTLVSMMHLAAIYTPLGRNAEAVKLYEAALAIQKAKLPAGHLNTILTMFGLAEGYAALGRHAEALKLFEETRTLTSAKLGANHFIALMSMMNEAKCYDALGRYADALKLREKALPLFQATRPHNDRMTLTAKSNLTVSYYTLGRYADAVKLCEQTLALQKAALGPDDPDTLRTSNNLALGYTALHRNVDAVKLYEETLALRKAKLGSDDAETLTTMAELASVYFALGRAADALKLCREALALRKAKLGLDHPDTLKSMSDLAAMLVSLDRGAEALPVIDECIQRATGKAVQPNLIPSVLVLRLRHFEKTKNAAGCRTTAEMWEKLHRNDFGSLYEASCMRAVTAAVLRASDPSKDAQKNADDDADRALVWLKQAVAAGYSDASHMQTDKDLIALRGRDDFKKLMVDVEAKAKRQEGKSQKSEK